MSTQPSWIVTLAPGQPAAGIARELARAGLTVEQVLDEIGIVTGRGSADLAPSLRAIAGVADVSPGSDIDIGPPGSGTTW